MKAPKNHSLENYITSFLKLESSSGIVLMFAASVAIILANTPLNGLYELLLSTPVEIRIGNFEIAKPLLLWINDGLMAIFFFLVGLELKRELIEGELSHRRNIILPGAGALGGMLVPALFYYSFNANNPMALQGWAIPAATDIAFALGILVLLGKRVPISLRMFLASLAIFDDIGAIVIIALFYTEKIAMGSLAVVAGCIVLLTVLNRRVVESKSVYMMIGIVMWAAMLKSGVHATLAGVILAIFVPMHSKHDPQVSPLKILEHDLHSTVAFIVLPLFAFANAGLDLTNVNLSHIMHPVPMGIACGLFLGKQIGVFTFCWLFIKLNWASMPKGMCWGSLYGTAALCGVGFTMSLFIGSLAFGEASMPRAFDERLGIIFGSLASGLLGYYILSKQLPKAP